MLRDEDCAVILCMAGSLFSAGLKNVVVDLVRHNMVDAIVSTGAIIVDQDFFEALGFKHYKGEINVDDDGKFVFGSRFENGSDYVVQIAREPISPVQSCVVDRGAGT
jgi:deoxyhypusine synthase